MFLYTRVKPLLFQPGLTTENYENILRRQQYAQVCFKSTALHGEMMWCTSLKERVSMNSGAESIGQSLSTDDFLENEPFLQQIESFMRYDFLIDHSGKHSRLAFVKRHRYKRSHITDPTFWIQNPYTDLLSHFPNTDLRPQQ